jgi:two-component system phosphate regulon sensor histidine kinase PhoR
MPLSFRHTSTAIFVPMKKVFPIIVLLVSLSLLGLIIFQASWLRNLLEVRQAQLLDKVETAGMSVVRNISTQAGTSSPFAKVPRKPGLKLSSDDFTGSRLLTISQRFSVNEVAERLQKAFIAQGLKDVHFEFAITSKANMYMIEMQSRDFLKESDDTIHNKIRIIPIEVGTGTMEENLIADEHLILIVPDFKTQVWESLRWIIAAAVFFTVVIIAAFYVTVRTLINQKKLSEIKSDFINNMTHEFKTPLATISLAVDAIRNEKVQNDKEKLQYFSGIIKEENKRMNRHVETILQAAVMEKQELKLNLKTIHVHEVIQYTMDNFGLQLLDKNGKIDLNLQAKNDAIEADEVHFSNLISNLVDNAIKYSKDNLAIRIATYNHGKMLAIKIEDNGIGMNKETVKRVFEKFYRAHTGNVHNVKGFGLGMSYVKTVIDAHKGKIRVESTLGKGSTFIVDIPVAKKIKSA